MHLEEPASCVELLQVGPVEAGGLVHLPVWKDLGHVRGPLQGAVSHQEGHPVHAKAERRRVVTHRDALRASPHEVWWSHGNSRQSNLDTCQACAQHHPVALAMARDNG